MRLADALRSAAIAACVLAAGGAPEPSVRIDVAGGVPVRVELRPRSGVGAARVLTVGGAGGGAAEAPCDGPSLAVASAEDDVVWPRTVRVAAGDSVRFHAERLRVVAVPAAEPVHLVPDRFAVPGGPPDRVDALQAWIDVERPVPRRSVGGARVVLVPATSWWVLGGDAVRPWMAHLGPDDERIGPGGRASRVLRDVPTVGGRPLPAGALVAAGRLDLAAAAAVRARVETEGCAAAVIVPRGAWRAVPLPDADTLTLWHPSFGLAYAVWRDDGPGDRPDDGVPAPCAIAFALPEAARLTGHAAVWPAWAGTGRVFSRPSDLGLRLAADGARRVVFRGLPPGLYRFDEALRPERAADAGEGGAARVETGDEPETLRKGAVRVTAEAPRRVVRPRPP